MGRSILYSTNVYLKYLIQMRWRNHIHYVWSSEDFDSAKAAAYTLAAGVPPSSNPNDIYKDLKQAVERGDSHNLKIKEQKASLTLLAVQWRRKREISTSDKQDIVWLVDKSPDFLRWRPLLYVIPRTSSINGRIQTVPASKSAGLGPEYIIEDLRESEFEIIEP